LGGGSAHRKAFTHTERKKHERTRTHILNSQNFKSLKLVLIVCLVLKCTSLKQAPTKHSVRHVVFHKIELNLRNTVFWDLTSCSPIEVLMFRRNAVPSSSGPKSKLRNRKETFRKLDWCLFLLRCSLSISATLRMEVVFFFRISGEFPSASHATRQFPS
jgi:hypothetical protein